MEYYKYLRQYVGHRPVLLNEFSGSDYYIKVSNGDELIR